MLSSRVLVGLSILAFSTPAIASDPTALAVGLMFLAFVIPLSILNFIIMIFLAINGEYKNFKVAAWHTAAFVFAPLAVLILHIAYNGSFPKFIDLLPYLFFIAISFLPIAIHRAYEHV